MSIHQRIFVEKCGRPQIAIELNMRGWEPVGQWEHENDRIQSLTLKRPRDGKLFKVFNSGDDEWIRPA